MPVRVRHFWRALPLLSGFVPGVSSPPFSNSIWIAHLRADNKTFVFCRCCCCCCCFAACSFSCPVLSFGLIWYGAPTGWWHDDGHAKRTPATRAKRRVQTVVERLAILENRSIAHNRTLRRHDFTPQSCRRIANSAVRTSAVQRMRIHPQLLLPSRLRVQNVGLPVLPHTQRIPCALRWNLGIEPARRTLPAVRLSHVHAQNGTRAAARVRVHCRPVPTQRRPGGVRRLHQTDNRIAA